MRVLRAAVVTLLLSCTLAWSADAGPGLQFHWPIGSGAIVELIDERSVGDQARTIVMTMRLRVEPDGATDRVVVRLSDAQLVSIDGASPGSTDPSHTLLAVGRVMKRLTPTMIVGSDGRFQEVRDLDRLMPEVLGAAGFPEPPPGLVAVFADFFTDLAAEDWSTWVGAWLGKQVAPGARTRLEASVVYPSEAVRLYAQGFLIDLAREARELGDRDPVASQRFIEKARYSPLTVTLTAELEAATMRPLFAERRRTFSAVHGGHKVEGLERRTHRFTWVP
jgi:hypothetical protein